MVNIMPFLSNEIFVGALQGFDNKDTVYLKNKKLMTKFIAYKLGTSFLQHQIFLPTFQRTNDENNARISIF